MRHDFDGIQAVGEHIIVERVKAADKTEGGILIPDTAKTSPPWWRVLRVGPKVTEDIRPGLRVLFRDGLTIEHQGRTISFVTFEQILAILQEPQKDLQ